MRQKHWLFTFAALSTSILLFLALIVGVAHPLGAKAASIDSPSSSGSGQPHFMKTRQAALLSSANTQPLVTYHLGAVMQSESLTYVIFWEPPTLPNGSQTYVSKNYNSLIQQYFNDVGGSGLYNNNTQYYEATNGQIKHIINKSVLTGTWIDTSSYPAPDCTDTITPTCMTDNDVQNEVAKAMKANGWSGGLTHLFFVFTSWEEGSCSNSTSQECAFTSYCGYHDYFSLKNQPVLYANIPYAGTLRSNCMLPESQTPNGDPDADSAINLVSHEQMESVTDPTFGGWCAASTCRNVTTEIGDLCAWQFTPTPPFPLDNGEANVEWNGHYYLVQEEWNKQLGKCALILGVSLKGNVYFGSMNQNVYSLSADDGSFNWMYQTGQAIRSSATEANGVIYIGSWDENLYALNASNGSLLWSFPAQGLVDTPTVVNGVVYFNTFASDYTYALNASTGALLWQYQTSTGGPVHQADYAPAVVNGLVYTATNSNYVDALNAKTGSLIWQYQTNNVVIATPAVAKGIVYIASTDNYVYALNAKTGSLIWRFQTGFVSLTSMPAIVNGVVYIGADSVYALNASSGSLIWQYRAVGGFSSSPVVAGNTAYVGSTVGTLYALNTSSGSLVWQYTISSNSSIAASPTVNNGVVLVGGINNADSGYSGLVYALNAKNASIIWQYQVPDGGVFNSAGVYSKPLLGP